jgi:hypothetical protein
LDNAFFIVMLVLWLLTLLMHVLLLRRLLAQTHRVLGHVVACHIAFNDVDALAACEH